MNLHDCNTEVRGGCLGGCVDAESMSGREWEETKVRKMSDNKWEKRKGEKQGQVESFTALRLVRERWLGWQMLEDEQ